VFPFALLLLLIGLPIIVATAVVQGRHAARFEAAAAAPGDSKQPAGSSICGLRLTPSCNLESRPPGHASRTS
jgi:hypothetical protein